MSSERKKIFLIDDTEFSLVRTKQYLKDYFTVYTLDSAVKMFELLDKVMPDLILLDINMPGMDGYEALSKLKTDKRYSGIPVIFLSAKEDEDSIIKGFDLGAVDHVIKPYTPKDLLDRISINLNPVKNQDELQMDTDKNVSKPSILAVDDSPSMLRSIHYALHLKYKVNTLQKPENLEKNLGHLKPDLILLDYNMPVINGIELARMIRSYPDFKKTPIIFLSAENYHDFVKDAQSLGISSFVLKPINPRKLREAIAKCLAKKQ